jgi:hypothetical protein
VSRGQLNEYVVNMIRFRRTLNFLLLETHAEANEYLSGYQRKDRDNNSYSIVDHEASSSRDTTCFFLSFSMAVKPFGPWPIFQLLSPIQSR